MRALIEEGLRHVIASRRNRNARFTLRDASFAGQGLTPEFGDAGWGEIRGAIYKGRGA
ncbi:MAG: hypothetical protein U0Q12_18840 [Vicinamibacterales bacterium]